MVCVGCVYGVYMGCIRCVSGPCAVSVRCLCGVCGTGAVTGPPLLAHPRTHGVPPHPQPRHGHPTYPIRAAASPHRLLPRSLRPLCFSSPYLYFVLPQSFLRWLHPPAAGPAGAAPPPGEVEAEAFPTQSAASLSVSPLLPTCATGGSGQEPQGWAGVTWWVQGLSPSGPHEQG